MPYMPSGVCRARTHASPVRRADAGNACAQTRLMAQEKGDGPVRYRGLLDALLKIPREEGLLALWKGLVPRLMRIPPGQARPPHPLPPHQQGGGSFRQRLRAMDSGGASDCPAGLQCAAVVSHMQITSKPRMRFSSADLLGKR